MSGNAKSKSLVVLNRSGGHDYDVVMALEIARLCLGLLIAGFHPRIADFVLEREALLILACRSRGFELPTALPRETVRNIFFAFGIAIALLQLLRLHRLTL